MARARQPLEGDPFLGNLVLDALPDTAPARTDQLLGFLADNEYTGPSYKVLNIGAANLLPAYSSELAVPLENCAEAIDRLFEVAARHRELGRVYHTGLVALRFVKASPAYLSMMHGRDTMMIELIQATDTEGGYELLGAYEEALYDLGGRPHFGQVERRSAGPLGRMYPEFDRWLAVHDELNATGVFDSPFAKRVGHQPGKRGQASPTAADSRSMLPGCSERTPRSRASTGGCCATPTSTTPPAHPVMAELAPPSRPSCPGTAACTAAAAYKSQVATAEYEGSRDIVARLRRRRPDDTVVFTRNTTEAINLLPPPRCRTAPRVLSSTTEHHANMLPWRRHDVRLLPSRARPTSCSRRRARAARRGIDLVAVTGASNVTGEVWPVAELAELAHEHGARIFVDAAQLAPHRAIDMARAGVDYLALLRPQALRPVRLGRAGRPPTGSARARRCSPAAARSSSSPSTT